MTRPNATCSQSHQASARITPAGALAMLRDGDTAELMGRADEVRRRLHGRETYFVHSLNLNPTNICRNRCELCAFWRETGAPDAYMMSLDEAGRHISAAVGAGLTDLHIVGGMADELSLEYYESLIRRAKQLLPSVLVQGMTAVEIYHLAQREELPTIDVLRRLKNAGLGAIPGGGAEIFADEIRERICSRKISASRWLAVHEQAHSIGLPTNATMLFGHIERPRDIVDHLTRLRDLQDRTGGFGALVALPFHPAGTQLSVARPPGGHVVARVVALARIFLDNFPHVRVLANYTDRKLLGVLAASGADDVGGTSLDERIAHAAGAPPSHVFASTGEIAAFVGDLGLVPVLTNSVYEHVAPRPAAEAWTGAPGAMLSNRATEALRRAEAGERIDPADAVVLHDEAPFQRLGAIAHRRRLEKVDSRRVTFVLDRNISITNVCEGECRFCAFHVAPGSKDSFQLSAEQITAKVRQADELGATQIMLQGGLNPNLDLAFYEEMLRSVKAAVGGVWLHSLSPAEVAYLAGRSGLSIHRTLQRLREAGLDSLPGGGAEILVDDVRRKVSPNKIGADEWFDVMRTAHDMGMKTTATMVYGLGETTAQRVEHLVRIRDLQDETGGFTAFIPWSFQPDRTQLSMTKQTGVDYLRIVAVARLVLDNVAHIQAGWLTEGADLAQLALSFGADDFGGILMEEHVVKAAGVTNTMTAGQVISLIGETGMIPAQRTTQYEIVRRHE